MKDFSSTPVADYDAVSFHPALWLPVSVQVKEVMLHHLQLSLLPLDSRLVRYQ